MLPSFFEKHRYLFPCEKISGSHRPDLHQKLVASKGGSDMGVAPFFAAFGFFVFWLPAFWDCAQAQSSRRGKTWSLRKHPVSRRAAEPCEKKLGPRLPAFQQLHIRFPGRKVGFLKGCKISRCRTVEPLMCLESHPLHITEAIADVGKYPLGWGMISHQKDDLKLLQVADWSRVIVLCGLQVSCKSHPKRELASKAGNEPRSILFIFENKSQNESGHTLSCTSGSIAYGS